MLKGSVFQNKYQKHDVSDFSESAEVIQGQILNDTPSQCPQDKMSHMICILMIWAFRWCHQAQWMRRLPWHKWKWYWEYNLMMKSYSFDASTALIVGAFFFLLKNVLRNSFLLNKASNATSKNKTKKKNRK